MEGRWFLPLFVCFAELDCCTLPPFPGGAWRRPSRPFIRCIKCDHIWCQNVGDVCKTGRTCTPKGCVCCVSHKENQDIAKRREYSDVSSFCPLRYVFVLSASLCLRSLSWIHYAIHKGCTMQSTRDAHYMHSILERKERKERKERR